MYKVLVIAVLGLLCLPLMAQDKVEVFGGYEYLHLGSNSYGPGSQGFNGWNAAATYKLNRLIGVEGDFSGTYAKVPLETQIGNVGWNVYTYAGGPVVSLPAPFIRPFAHALFGGMRMTASADGVSTSWNGFTTTFGGGADLKVNRLFAIRLGQVDWLYYHFGSKTVAGTQLTPSFSSSSNVRFSTGVVLRF